MKFCTKFILFISVVIIALVYQKFRNLTKPLDAPEFNLNQYWGSGNSTNYIEDKSIKPQEIYYPDNAIEELKQKLNVTLKLHEPLEGTAFEYGFNSNKLKQIVNYWRDIYLPKWNERIKYLNSFSHFTTEIQGLNIHYIHQKVSQKSSDKKTIPILLLHGWPGSVREFYELIPMFMAPNSKYQFEIVAPSLPGYGWSEPARKPRFGIAEMAVVMRNLMLRLGYDKFYIQGGDWGSLIGSNIATLFPDNVLGYHSNVCATMTLLGTMKTMIASFYPSYFIDKEYEDFVFPVMEKLKFMIEESGYLHIQATKPDTIGIALSQNPIGLAAYILEKFSSWTNPKYRTLTDGGLENDFNGDALLDNVMIYYLTNSITTSVRLYSESFSVAQFSHNLNRVPTKVPTGCARFKYDVLQSIDWELKDKYTNLIHSTYHKNGGHFAAMEVPDVLYDDFIVFLEKININ